MTESNCISDFSMVLTEIIREEEMKIVVLAGGISTERDVSLVSGTGVYNALKKLGHDAVLLDVFMGYKGSIDNIFTKDYDWTKDIRKVSESAPDIKKIKEIRGTNPNVLFGENVLEICKEADIVFMALHGDCGENGKIQATFDLLDIKYTGTDYLSSALAMDKSITKSVFIQHSVNTPEGYVIYKNDDKKKLEPEFMPCVVKVCSGGSSVGVYIVNTSEEYFAALDEAFEYENKVLVEKYIKGREVTDCVINNEALPIVEIVAKDGVYDYKNKYQVGGAVETCPAPLSDELTEKVKTLALRAYDALGIKVYARMDFIIDENNEVYCLEANTLPGMTPTSLIPLEARTIGKSYEQLCQWIVEVSLEKYNS